MQTWTYTKSLNRKSYTLLSTINFCTNVTPTWVHCIYCMYIKHTQFLIESFSQLLTYPKHNITAAYHKIVKPSTCTCTCACMHARNTCDHHMYMHVYTRTTNLTKIYEQSITTLWGNLTMHVHVASACMHCAT